MPCEALGDHHRVDPGFANVDVCERAAVAITTGGPESDQPPSVVGSLLLVGKDEGWVAIPISSGVIRPGIDGSVKVGKAPGADRVNELEIRTAHAALREAAIGLAVRVRSNMETDNAGNSR